jgi:hypothetical protein
VWENAVDFIAEIKRRYKTHVSYTIKMKCCDGSYDNPDGMVEVSKLQKDEQYYCDEQPIPNLKLNNFSINANCQLCTA